MILLVIQILNSPCLSAQSSASEENFLLNASANRFALRNPELVIREEDEYLYASGSESIFRDADLFPLEDDVCIALFGGCYQPNFEINIDALLNCWSLVGDFFEYLCCPNPNWGESDILV